MWTTQAMPLRSDRRPIRGWWAVLAVAFSFSPPDARSPSPPVSRLGGPSSAPADATGQASPSTEDASLAANVLRDYYRAINERRYEDAYHLWASGGAASGQTLETFRDGFASTTSVEVTIGIPGPIEGAAGSRYVEIPVRIAAVDEGRHAPIVQRHLHHAPRRGRRRDARAARMRIHSAKVSGTREASARSAARGLTWTAASRHGTTSCAGGRGSPGTSSPPILCCRS
jgi:hypothetical protein